MSRAFVRSVAPTPVALLPLSLCERIAVADMLAYARAHPGVWVHPHMLWSVRSVCSRKSHALKRAARKRAWPAEIQTGRGIRGTVYRVVAAGVST